ncbi:MAG TPA: hypothetical protein V6C86_23580 [Oculatellaceae cyanobacterium]
MIDEPQGSADKSAIVVEQFTADQEAELSSLAAHFKRPARPRAADREAVKQAIRTIENKSDAETKLLWCQSPWQVVTLTAMITLWIHGGYELTDKLRSQLKDDQWQHMFNCLYEQLSDQSLSTELAIDDFVKPNLLVATDRLSSPAIRQAELIEKMDSTLAPQVSLIVKLRLREIFAQQQEATGRIRGMQQILVRTPFGLSTTRNLLNERISATIEEQVDETTRRRIEDFWGQHETVSPPILGLNQQNTIIDRFFNSFGTQSFTPPAVLGKLLATQFIARRFPVSIDSSDLALVNAWVDLADNVFNLSWSQRIHVVCDSPMEAHLDNNDMLHNENGPALRFRDGSEVFAIHGVVLPHNVIRDAATISVEQIDKEPNAEVRRILIQRYGEIRYLQDSDATEIDSDEYGTLYKKPLLGDEPMVIVKVKNSTPEPDGTFKHYYLRVPPYVTTARAAVAWTFDMKPEEYKPFKQT